MNDKTYLIANVNLGIGKQAAVQLAKFGFYIHIDALNKKREHIALTEIL